jgi:LacI family transcriptional regulator
MKKAAPAPLRPRRRSPARPRVLLLQSWWQDRVLEGVARYAAQHHWILDCEMRWTRRLPALRDWQGDGIIAYVGITRPMRSLINFVRAQRAPVVLTQSEGAGLNAPRVIIPHAEVGAAAAAHLLELNFRHFGFVEFGDNVLEHGRSEGFREVVEAADGSFRVLRIKDLPRQLARLPRPMGLFAANDLNAVAVIRACLDAGFRVPEELAVVGVDNAEILCNFAPVPLTSVNCNFEQQGYAAAALLQRLMRGGRAPARPVVISPNGVTVRRSTDTIATPDPEVAKALRFLRDHYRENISMREVATVLDRSLRRVQSVFREHIGRTMVQELIRLRVEHAKSLLGDRKRKLHAIAAESGFANRHHMMRAFSRTTGRTPAAFRASIAGNRA